MPRADEVGAINNAVNLGNYRKTISDKEGDHEAYEQMVAEDLEQYAIDLIDYRWMPNSLSNSASFAREWSNQ